VKRIQQRVLPYSQEQLFELIADVERYPEFVPWWIAARIRHRDGDTIHVEQVIGLGAVRQRFTSQAIFRRPVSVQVTSNDGPFRHLEISWTITPVPGEGCTVTLSPSFDLRSKILQRLLGAMLSHETCRLIEVFERRAHQLYGDPIRV
jgi:coenzyme Q-binding protein COQ10